MYYVLTVYKYIYIKLNEEFLEIHFPLWGRDRWHQGAPGKKREIYTINEEKSRKSKNRGNFTQLMKKKEDGHKREVQAFCINFVFTC